MSLPNVFLIGFMGSGKSHWGKIWARKNHLSFSDLDSEVEKAFGMRIVDIFEKHGEDKFRELEKYHLRKIEHSTGHLVSCGGGTPCFFDNMEWMKKNGIVVYLKASPRYLLDRVMEETSERPLLKEVNRSELLFYIQKKLNERAPVYEQADIILNAESLDNTSLEKIFETA
ncbi:MAG: shikimate kinase [Chitinophagaceae bacterium]|nr:shikimate kinase [Chitinophagaceae bacterium]MCZ2395909.1 shikimate kinase [Chitinophagales bacterium]